PARGHPGRYLLGRGDRRRARGRRPARDGRQDHRCHPAELRRALSLDRALRRALSGGGQRMELTEAQFHRYARHLILDEVGEARLEAANAAAIIAGYDLVADGSDNFATRYLLTDLCHAARKPLVAAALAPFDGQLSTFKPYLGAGHPCYRCLFREPPPPDLVP